MKQFKSLYLFSLGLILVFIYTYIPEEKTQYSHQLFFNAKPYTKYFLRTTSHNNKSINQEYLYQEQNITNKHQNKTVKFILDSKGSLLEAQVMHNNSSENIRSFKSDQHQITNAAGQSYSLQALNYDNKQPVYPLLPLEALSTPHILQKYYKNISSTSTLFLLDLITATIFKTHVFFDKNMWVLKDMEQQIFIKITKNATIGPGSFWQSSEPPPLQAAYSNIFPDYKKSQTSKKNKNQKTFCFAGDLPYKSLELDGPGQKKESKSCITLDKKHISNTINFNREELKKKTLQIDHRDPDIIYFAQKYRASNKTVVSDALKLAEIIYEKLDTRKKAAIPTASHTLRTWQGDCDQATALLVASLRSLGHQAKAVVGYKIIENQFKPHAWAQVLNNDLWINVDALPPQIGNFSDRIQFYEGLGTPFDMGRILGKWTIKNTSLKK